jgi:hypothetical protein
MASWDFLWYQSQRTHLTRIIGVDMVLYIPNTTKSNKGQSTCGLRALFIDAGKDIVAIDKVVVSFKGYGGEGLWQHQWWASMKVEVSGAAQILVTRDDIVAMDRRAKLIEAAHQ